MDIGLAVTESGKSVTVFLNGNFTDGKEIILSPLWTTDDFLQAAARRLGMAKATRMFTPDGHEVDDILYLEEKEILFVV